MRARRPIAIGDAQVALNNKGLIVVKGKLGELSLGHPNGLVDVQLQDKFLTVKPVNLSIEAIQQTGTLYANLINAVKGVNKQFEEKLLLVGVGYRANVQGQVVHLNVGYSHPVLYKIPHGIVIETPIPTEIVIKGIDRQLVGQVAADIRAFRPPEPYKGKGIRRAGEVIKLKETKKK